MSRMITLVSHDSHHFDVEEAAVLQSETLKALLRDIPICKNKRLIPLMNVSGNILAKVVQYFKEHLKDDGRQADDIKMALKQFDSEFVKVDEVTLLQLIHAANYLNIKSLLTLMCRAVAERMKGKSIEEIREKFNIKNDFSPEEEEDLRFKNQWAEPY